MIGMVLGCFVHTIWFTSSLSGMFCSRYFIHLGLFISTGLSNFMYIHYFFLCADISSNISYFAYFTQTRTDFAVYILHVVK